MTKDNEDELIYWAIKHILVPSLINYSDEPDSNFNTNEN